MPLFNHDESTRRKLAETSDKQFVKEVEEELSERVVHEKTSSVTRAISEADQAITEATRQEITRMKLIEHGCCPACHGRIERFLYTTVCPSCGWVRRMVPDSGHCIVHMDTGEKIPCDHVYNVGTDQFLCVSDGVVRSHAMRQHVRRIEYVWDEEELKEAKKKIRKRFHGVCSWCENELQATEDNKPLEEYVAFGAVQERYIFCSLKCLESFRKQYPPRVHRNCYETDCDDCDKCIKRFNSHGFKRIMPTK